MFRGATGGAEVVSSNRPSPQTVPFLLPNSMLKISFHCFWIWLPKEQKGFGKRNWPLAAKGSLRSTDKQGSSSSGATYSAAFGCCPAGGLSVSSSI
jgi:hypothetical protein